MSDIQPGMMVVNTVKTDKFTLWLKIPQEEPIPKVSTDAEALKSIREAYQNSGPKWRPGQFGSVLEVQGNWVRVMTPAGIGWAHLDSVEAM